VRRARTRTYTRAAAFLYVRVRWSELIPHSRENGNMTPAGDAVDSPCTVIFLLCLHSSGTQDVLEEPHQRRRFIPEGGRETAGVSRRRLNDARGDAASGRDAFALAFPG